jgi:hypothetical protein
MGCGAGKPAQAPDDTGTANSEDYKAKKKDDSSSSSSGSGGEEGKDANKDTGGGGDGAKPDAPKADVCTGFEFSNLEDVLSKSACEARKDDKVTTIDAKDKLEVKLIPSAAKIEPGGHVDLMVQITNKTKAPMALSFTIDPLPRFEVETYDKKNSRIDMPKSSPPPLPAGVAPRGPGEAKNARITLAANGVARMRVGWDAVKMQWAPEKVRGSAPEKGYPRKPAGPLAKGKYTVRVVTPLNSVNEGMEHEVSAPKVEIEVGK